MNIGINWECYHGLPFQEKIRLFQKNGFTSTFVSPDGNGPVPVLEEIQAEGLVVETVHAPFDGINNMWLPGPEGDRMLNRILHCVQLAAEHHIPVVVSHVSSGPNPPMIGDIGNARFRKLMEKAREYGVTIAFENQRKVAQIALMLETYPDARLCWDCGHEACFTPGKEFAALFGDRIAAIHIHDNLGVENGDLHLIPGDGNIDMEKVCQTLKTHGYTGTFMLELHPQNNTYYQDMPPEIFFKKAAEAAKKRI